MRINSVVQMKFGDICKILQPHGDIERFMKKKELMNAIIGKFLRFHIPIFYTRTLVNDKRRTKKDQIQEINRARIETLDLIVLGTVGINS